MRVDAHQHFWIYEPVRDAWIDNSMQVIRRDFLPADLSGHLEKHNIDGCIAVQADQSEDETNFLLKLADENPWISGVVGWVDLMALDIEQKLEHYASFPKLKGFRHIVEAEPDDHFMLGDTFQRGISFLANFNFTYDVLIFPKQLWAAIQMVENFPEQNFVLDHIAKPDIKNGVMEPWASEIKEIAKNENLYCKVSGIITEADHQNWNRDEIYPYLDVIFEAFGTDRLLYGSDWPVCLLAGSYEQVYQLIEKYVADFSEQEKAKIFGDNSAKIYGLKE